MLDLDATAPAHDALAYKNLPLQAVLAVLRCELDAADAADEISLSLVESTARRAPPATHWPPRTG
eukprot:6085878-Prymnesium_polylepis.1